MVEWLDTAIEKAGSPVEVDVSHLGLEVQTLQVIPLSAAEFQVLKSEPEIARLEGDDRNEVLGLRVCYEMLAKCDKGLSWKKFRQLPLTLLGAILTAITETVGQPLGGGELGE